MANITFDISSISAFVNVAGSDVLIICDSKDKMKAGSARIASFCSLSDTRDLRLLAGAVEQISPSKDNGDSVTLWFQLVSGMQKV